MVGFVTTTATTTTPLSAGVAGKRAFAGPNVPAPTCAAAVAPSRAVPAAAFCLPSTSRFALSPTAPAASRAACRCVQRVSRLVAVDSADAPATTAPAAARTFEMSDSSVSAGKGQQQQQQQQQQEQLDTVLVVGATGRTGREVVRLLRESGVCKSVRAAVRDTAKFERESGAAGAPATTELDVRGTGDLSAAPDDDVAKLVDGVDAIVWAAGATGGSAEQGTQEEFAPGRVDYGALERLVRVAAPSLCLREPSEHASIVDFRKCNGPAAAAFASVDDTVMGGRSASAVEFDSTEDDGRGASVFAGNASTEYGGGFAQVRCNAEIALAAGETGFGTARLQPSGNAKPRTAHWDVSAYDGIAITVRGDGRRYKLNLTTADSDHDRALSFQQAFDTTQRVTFTDAFGIGGASNEYETHFLPFDQFVPMRRGSPVYGDGADVYGARLNASRIRSVGLMVSKVAVGGGTDPKFTPGKFRLAVRNIGAYRAVPPRFVVLSSAAVTRPFWSEERKRSNPAVANIPIVNLNPSNVLGFKLKGEDAVRTSSSTGAGVAGNGTASGADVVVPYAIVRPVGLNEDMQGGRGAVLGQGDTMSGRASRAKVAEVLVAVLGERDAFCKTFEMAQAENDGNDEQARGGSRVGADKSGVHSSGGAYGPALRALRTDVARRMHP